MRFHLTHRERFGRKNGFVSEQDMQKRKLGTWRPRTRPSEASIVAQLAPTAAWGLDHSNGHRSERCAPRLALLAILEARRRDRRSRISVGNFLHDLFHAGRSFAELSRGREVKSLNLGMNVLAIQKQRHPPIGSR
jgi:hypothetical protein